MSHLRSTPVSESTPAEERWLPVVGYEGYYSVSDHGRVRAEQRVIMRAGGKGPLPRREMILRPGTHHGGGYQQVTLSRNGHRSSHQVHVLVLTAFVGSRPDGLEACHGPNGPADNRLTQLRWDTRSSNVLDQVEHGTHPMTSRQACPRKHRLIHPNLVPSLAKRGYRDCLACNRARTTAKNWRKRRGIEIDWVPLAHENYARLMGATEVAA